MIRHARVKEGLYYHEDSNGQITKKHFSRISFLVKSNKDVLWLHHFRLGYPSFSVLQFMFPSLFKGLDIRNFQCDICQLVKHIRVSFHLNNNRSSLSFTLIYSDIWGPSLVPNLSGTQWFVLFVDDCTQVVWLYLLKAKLEVSSIFPNFYTMIKNKFGAEIKRVRTDNTKKKINQTFFLKRRA